MRSHMGVQCPLVIELCVALATHASLRRGLETMLQNRSQLTVENRTLIPLLVRFEALIVKRAIIAFIALHGGQWLCSTNSSKCSHKPETTV